MKQQQQAAAQESEKLLMECYGVPRSAWSPLQHSCM